MADRALKAGDPVVVVEHDEATRAPREGGCRFPARVVATEGIYVQVRYENPAGNGGRPDAFYKDSGWRAWDRVMRWRLTTEESNRG